MEEKHTPGPWNANWTRISGQAIGFHITDPKHGSLRPICEAYDKTGAMSSDEIEANARLIAAAPELLEVAQEVLADDMLQYLPAEYVAKVRAAIAKATGEVQAPYTCRYCGRPSWLEPIDQSPPPDYCHDSDHGTGGAA